MANRSSIRLMNGSIGCHATDREARSREFSLVPSGAVQSGLISAHRWDAFEVTSWGMTARASAGAEGGVSDIRGGNGKTGGTRGLKLQTGSRGRPMNLPHTRLGKARTAAPRRACRAGRPTLPEVGAVEVRVWWYYVAACRSCTGHVSQVSPVLAPARATLLEMSATKFGGCSFR